MKIRQASQKDISEIVKIDKEAFGDSGITKKMVRSQLSAYPNGALVAVDKDKLLGVVFCERHKRQSFPLYVHDVSKNHQDKGSQFICR